MTKFSNRAATYAVIGLTLSLALFLIFFIGSDFTGPEEVCIVDDWYGKQHLSHWEACRFQWDLFAALIGIYWALIGGVLAFLGESVAMMFWLLDKLPSYKQ